MSDLDWLFAGLLGAGGSVLGGAVGGWYALRGVHQQWKRDRQDFQMDRSHQAAIAIGQAVSTVAGAIDTWELHHDNDALKNAYHSFTDTVYFQNFLVEDREVRSRVFNHIGVIGAFVAEAMTSDGPTETTIRTMRRHTNEVIRTLYCHVDNEVLPAYQAPPLKKGFTVLGWAER
jgi:hypothetical protein